MKISRLTITVVSAIVLSAAGMSAVAQTAPAAPAAPAATPAAPAATPAAGIPAAYANDPVVAQVNTQLTAQGFTITNVTVNAAGAYVIDAVSATGVVRQLIVDPATGTVTDSLGQGLGNGMPGDDGNETADTPDSTDSNSTDTGSMDSGSNDSGSNDSGSNDNGSGDSGADN